MNKKVTSNDNFVAVQILFIFRLRDWIISTECLLIKEIYTQIAENIYSISRVVGV